MVVVRAGRLRSTVYADLGKITINPRLEEIKIVMVGKAPSWDSVPQSNSSWEEANQVELTPY